MARGQRSIYRDDFELLHEGMKRMATVQHWILIERPAELDPEAPPAPKLVTLETLGLAHLRPIPEPPEVMACETCVHRANATGDGPCVDCDLTFDGAESNYCAESDRPVRIDFVDDEPVEHDLSTAEELETFAAESAELDSSSAEAFEAAGFAAPGDDDEDDDDGSEAGEGNDSDTDSET